MRVRRSRRGPFILPCAFAQRPFRKQQNLVGFNEVRVIPDQILVKGVDAPPEIVDLLIRCVFTQEVFCNVPETVPRNNCVSLVEGFPFHNFQAQRSGP